MRQLSVRESLRGRNLLVTGASGFVGKVWLAMLLEWVPDTGRIYLLLRPGKKSAHQRLNDIFESPVFQAVWRRNDESTGARIRARVQPISGDVSQVDLGIAATVSQVLRDELDLIVNLAGLVDFDPDVRDAYAANIEGPLRVADFTASCQRAKLLHVSTAFVSGKRSGRIREQIEAQSPNGIAFDPHAEWQWLQAEISHGLDAASGPEVLEKLRQELRTRGHECSSCERRRCAAPALGATRLRAAMTTLGAQRSRALGWSNTYTYSKSLSERLLASRADIGFAIFRPAIVESSYDYPFPGWNEGFNTSGPIIQLLGTWIHRVRVGINKPLDLVPVDYVAKGMMTVLAALTQDCHVPIYHCGSSDLNPITLDRCVELSTLSYRKHWRDNGQSWLERQVLSRWDARAVMQEPKLGIAQLKKLSNGISMMAKSRGIPLLRTQLLESLGHRCEIWARKLARTEMLLQTYEPFLCECPSVYECKSLRTHDILEPEFRFSPEVIDWHDYMLRCHIPGLHRWCMGDSQSQSSGASPTAVPITGQREFA